MDAVDDARFADELTEYASHWPEEAATVELFRILLADAADPFRRERLAGHFTASCWLVDRTAARVLLTHHRKLGLWLQLGGHADGERDLRIAALKEAEEESGLGGLRIDAGIFDGDLLAVHKTNQARDGQIVVARLDEEVTVKRLQHRGGFIELIAENPDFEPIIVNPGEVDFAIEGIAVGLIRGAISTLS